jgi:outer membrane protein OmpA-like peptidoglycan-associated protein
MNPQVNFMFGDCKYKKASDASWKKAYIGLRISKNFEFKTGQRSFLDLLLQEKCAVRIKANSYLNIKEIDPDVIKMQMKSGVLFGKIHKLLKGQELSVKSPTALAAVRGTEFCTEIENGKTTGFCVDGKVEISAQNKKTMIAKYLKTSVSQNKAPQPSVKMTQKEIKIIEKEIASIRLEKLLLMTNNLLFKPGKFEVHNNMKPELDKIMKTFKEVKGVIQVVGHTDNTGGAALNKKLSQKRAEAIMQYFITKGMTAHRVQALGMGQSRPAFRNDTAQGRAQNRRVEFVVIKKD